MVDKETYSATLIELDAIANAAMTPSQREMRAAPVLKQSGIALADLCAALLAEDLPWNERRAAAFGVSGADWKRALDVAGLASCDSLGSLLEVIHRAESAAAMLRAGYRPERGEDGTLNWTR